MPVDVSFFLFPLQFPVLAVVRNGQQAANAAGPALYPCQVVMHFAGIESGCVSECLDYCSLSGYHVYPFSLFVPQIGMLHRVFHPFSRRKGSTVSDEVSAHFGVPSVLHGILRKAAAFAPRLYLDAVAVAGLEEFRELLAYGLKVGGV